MPATTESSNNNEPTKKKSKYNQKYKQEWEDGREWLENADFKAFCKYCKTFLANDVTLLDRHANTKKHMNAVNTKDQARLKQITISESVEKNSETTHQSKELAMVMYCVQHSLPFTLMDTLPKLLNFLSSDERGVKCCSKKQRL